LERDRYRRELARTDPDFVVYVPRSEEGRDAENQHFLVVPTLTGDFLAFWTQASWEASADQRVVVSRSADRGESWSNPREIDGPSEEDPEGTGLASWGFPFVPPEEERIYCFYNKNVGTGDVRGADTGRLHFRYSDDDGRTWSEETPDLPLGGAALDHPDPEVPPTWITYQKPVVTPGGAVLAGFTRWASNAYHPTSKNAFERESEIWFLRFENLLAAPDPEELRVTTWPEGRHGLRVPHPGDPEISVAQEPAIQPLSDGRLICLMRTLKGMIYYSLSVDDGKSWSKPRILRYGREGEPLLNPIAPCPIYRLEDGRFLLFFYNNDGRANGGWGPGDYKRNRTPLYYSLGREKEGAGQPLEFDFPRYLLGSDGVSVGPMGRTEVATYPSFFEYEGEAYFWYPDRKHFLLGKRMTDLLY